MLHLGSNAVLGFCWWDLLSLVLLAGVAALFAVRHRALTKTKEELEDNL